MTILLFNHRQRGKIMALRSKNEEPQIVEKVEERTNHISFDDLEFEADYEEERSAVQYVTISGKVQQYEPEWEQYGMQDLDIGNEMEGRVEITHFVNEGRKSDSLRVRVMDDGEIVNLYVNIPKPDENGFINNIR